MATASVTTTFANTTLAKSAEVNDNFDDLVVFANDETIHRDGSKAATGNLPMGGNKLTGLGAPTVAGDAVRFEEYVPVTIVDAKGDLLVASAADTPARLAVGPNTDVLIAASGEALGVKWGPIVRTRQVPDVLSYALTDNLWNQATGTPEDVPNIALPVGANEIWRFELVVDMTPPGPPGTITFRMKASTIPAGATTYVTARSTGGASSASVTLALSVAAVRHMDVVQGSVLTGGSSGTITFEVTNTANTVNFTIHKHTHLIAWRLA